MKSDAANQIRHGDHCDAFRKQTIKLCCDLPGPRLSVLIQWKKIRRKQREEEKKFKNNRKRKSLPGKSETIAQKRDHLFTLYATITIKG